jgi:hypothetical protein
MLELGEQGRLAAEAPGELHVGLPEDFERYGFARLPISRPVHYAHSTYTRDSFEDEPARNRVSIAHEPTSSPSLYWTPSRTRRRRPPGRGLNIGGSRTSGIKNRALILAGGGLEVAPEAGMLQVWLEESGLSFLDADGASEGGPLASLHESQQ